MIQRQNINYPENQPIIPQGYENYYQNNITNVAIPMQTYNINTNVKANYNYPTEPPYSNPYNNYYNTPIYANPQQVARVVGVQPAQHQPQVDCRSHTQDTDPNALIVVVHEGTMRHRHQRYPRQSIRTTCGHCNKTDYTATHEVLASDTCLLLFLAIFLIPFLIGIFLICCIFSSPNSYQVIHSCRRCHHNLGIYRER